MCCNVLHGYLVSLDGAQQRQRVRSADQSAKCKIGTALDLGSGSEDQAKNQEGKNVGRESEWNSYPIASDDALWDV